MLRLVVQCLLTLPTAVHARDENLKDFKDTHVIIVGGGYGGIGAAKKLKDQCKVTLIDARDAFHHNMGAQRSSVETGVAFCVFRAIKREKCKRRAKCMSDNFHKINDEFDTLHKTRGGMDGTLRVEQSCSTCSVARLQWKESTVIELAPRPPAKF